jgi:hypothetical protein
VWPTCITHDPITYTQECLYLPMRARLFQMLCHTSNLTGCVLSLSHLDDHVDQGHHGEHRLVHHLQQEVPISCVP